MKKYCTRCGKPFDAIGREVICPSCKAQAAEENKRAAVLKAKRASWTGESVPVRISGRASTVIRECGKAHDLPFAAALDALLKETSFFESLGVEWEDVTPYKSRRRDKHTTEDETGKQDGTQTTSKPQDAPQDAPQESKPQESKPQEVTKAAKTTSKTSTTVTSKSSSKSSKASKSVSTK